MSAPCKIILVDDHKLFTDGLQQILESEPDFKILHRFYNATDCISFLETCRDLPDIIITDLNMPGLNGLDLIDQVYTKYPDVKVICLSVRDDMYAIQKVLKRGVLSFLSKDADVDEFKEAIRSVIAGKKYFSKNITDKIFHNQPNRQHQIHKVVLTERETEVLKCISQGWTNIEIGKKLYLSENTIATHRKNIQLKLQAKNVAEIISIAYSQGWL